MKPLRVASAFDPALYRDPNLRPAVAQYRESRRFDLIPAITRPGMSPAIFTLRRLTRSQWGETQRKVYLWEQQQVAFRAGLASIEGSPLGEVWRPAEPVLSEAELDLLFETLGPDTLAELGALVLEETRCPKGRVRSFRLPLSCLHALAAMPSDPLCVDESPERAADPSKSAP